MNVQSLKDVLHIFLIRDICVNIFAIARLDFGCESVYNLCIYKGVQMMMAKVFKSGNSQAVRLPKEDRLDTDEVSVNRIGNVLIMVPKDDPRGVFSQGICEIGDDFPEHISSPEHSKQEFECSSLFLSV